MLREVDPGELPWAEQRVPLEPTIEEDCAALMDIAPHEVTEKEIALYRRIATEADRRGCGCFSCIDNIYNAMTFSESRTFPF